MTQLDERAPVIVGVGQRIERDVDPREAQDPIELMLAATRDAAADAGVAEGVLGALDRVIVPLVLGGSYSNAARLLAERLGASAATPIYLPVGGNTPQRMLNESARSIAAGRAELVLLAGAEALDTRRRAREAGIVLDWNGGGAPSPSEPEPSPTSALEWRHGLVLPPVIYPLYENALRAHHARDPETHRRLVGTMLARLSDVAAENPYAWFPKRRTADEITVAGPDNRMVAFPYTKLMNAILTVNQSAAILLTSAGRARALGVPEDRLVHWLGGGDALETPWTLSERPDFHSSNGMANACAAAFAEAGLGVADVGAFDFYSCFPSAIELACDSLGLGLDDPRPLSVTGGLACAGGPGNNYSSHAIASMVQRIREDRSLIGMVTGIGWYFSKHSAGLYGAAPTGARATRDARPSAATSAPSLPVAERAEGRGRVEAWTVLHDRSGEPERGIVIGRLEDGRRFVAQIEGDAHTLAAFEQSEGCGRSGQLRPEGERNLFAPD